MRVSLRSKPLSIRLTRRDRVIHSERSGGRQSLVLKGVRCRFSSHVSVFLGEELPEELSLRDDLAFKIPTSNERLRNQTFQTTTSLSVLKRYANALSYLTLNTSINPKKRKNANHLRRSEATRSKEGISMSLTPCVVMYSSVLR